MQRFDFRPFLFRRRRLINDEIMQRLRRPVYDTFTTTVKYSTINSSF